MNSTILGYLIGGIIPAVLLGIFSLLQKAASQRGISTGIFLLIVGFSVMVIGLEYCLIFKEYTVSGSSGVLASLNGIFWGTATTVPFLFSFRFSKKISKC